MVDPDRIDASCQGPARVSEACTSRVVVVPEIGAAHVPEPTPISYTSEPPSSGDHRPAWARWGEYDYLPPQRWLHNLEHGGIALLYDPCVASELVDALREFARARPDDASGPFRWVLTPYPGLPTPIAAVAWETTWESQCVDASLGAFVDSFYRQAPEDVASDGSYTTGWIGR
ncbi:MAG: DUF3105 domain-containing protein [Deltaproteobacteria bacterium]|nr:DUF3105 domain-containing protein [Deltaproteobacteria bacterium]